MSEPEELGISKLILIVLYQTKLLVASTVESIVKCREAIGQGDKVIIWDNSLKPQLADDVEQLVNQLRCSVQYRHTPENISLAAIYNTAVRENPDFTFCFLMDQDSTFDIAYFTDIKDASVQHPRINLFVPLIRSGDIIVSPGDFHYIKGKYWKKALYGVVPAKNTVAVTSGMAIRMSYLKGFGGFEERLQLYGIDSNFMLRYSRDNSSFFVVGSLFGHHLSDFTAEPREIKLRRFRDFQKASIINSGLFPMPVQLLTKLFLWYKRLRF